MNYPKDLTDAIERANNAVQTYYNRGDGMQLKDLHTLQDRLSSLLYFIGDQEATMKGEYNNTRFKREITFNRSRMNFRKDGHNGGDSDAKANQVIEDDKREELEKEAFAYRLQTLIKRSDKILSSISQRITTLRDEMQYTRKLESYNSSNEKSH